MVELRARVGMVFQKPNPFPKSIYENVAYGPQDPRPRPHQDRPRRDRASPRCAAPASGTRSRIACSEPGTGLSGGQQQRLCIARAIATKPEVLLMDEPCSALDPIATAIIEELIDELRENFTIVIVTHSMQQAARVSQKTAFFHLGKLIEEGETERHLHQPAEQADPGLHHRPYRLTDEDRSPWRTALNEHIVTSYEDELTNLNQAISEMGGMVEQAITDAATALLKLDHKLATGRALCRQEDRRACSSRINDMAVSIIARRQPMAADLRMVVTSIQVANDLERTGDMAKQLAKRTLQIEGLGLAPKFYNGVKHMTDLVARQLKARSTPTPAATPPAAVDVCNRDDEVDAMHTSLFRELLTYMMEDPRNITQCTHLLFCTKSLERVGDHATNIAEAPTTWRPAATSAPTRQQRQQALR